MPKSLFHNDLLDQSRKFVSDEFVSALLEHPSNQTSFQMCSWKASFMDICSTCVNTHLIMENISSSSGMRYCCRGRTEVFKHFK